MVNLLRIIFISLKVIKFHEASEKGRKERFDEDVLIIRQETDSVFKI